MVVLLINTKGGLIMESIPKTISFRTDEVTAKKMEKIKDLVFEGREVSNALILRTAIDFLHDNYGKGISNTEDMFEVVKSYITATYLKQQTVEFDELDSLLWEVKQVFDEHYQEEIQEIAMLYDDENPITIAQLIRFKSRELPETFLRIMEVDDDEYSNLSTDELAELLMKKLSDDSFKEKAKTLFKMVL